MPYLSRVLEYLRSLAEYWREVVFVLATLAVTNVFFEVAYRGYQYWTLPSRLFHLVAANIPANYSKQSWAGQVYVPDAHAGYMYTPNFEGERGHPWYSHWRTNSHGHVSKFEYPIEKPPGEYRIAIVGDSMTANITNNVRWTELLEQDLNASPKWKARVGGKFTRVINFAVDGMGMIQFAGMVRHHVMPFQPDFIIVNFVSDDILRRLRYVSVPAWSTDRDANLRAYVKTYLDRINWLSFRSELFAATVGHLWGMQCQLPLDPKELLASGPAQKFTNRAEAIATSKAAVADMLSVFPNILFLQIPLFQELENQPIREWRGLVEDLRKAIPQANIVSMRAQMDALLEGKRLKERPDLAGMTLHQITALPDDRRLEIYRWFFLPEDAHYTDYGITLYQREVAKYLMGR